MMAMKENCALPGPYGDIGRVIVTGDILRPYPLHDGGWEPATEKNINWLYRVMTFAMSSLDVPVERFMWSERTDIDARHHFDAPMLYASLGLDVGTPNWARMRSSSSAVESLVVALRGITRNSLVVGYEMPPAMIDALDELDVPFIDIVLHPIRFLPDLLFGFRSNRSSAQAFFQSQAIAPDSIRRSAALITAKAAWMPPPQAELVPGTLLLLGQVANDASLSRPDGTFLSLADFRAQLLQLSFDYSQVLYKPHPYEAGHESMHRLLADFPSFKPATDNFYRLVARDEVCGVAAINSSGLVEAPYFGCESIGLAAPLYRFDDTEDGHVGIDNRWLAPHFWQALFSGGPEHAAATLPADTLRKSMNADWGFGQIDQVCA